MTKQEIRALQVDTFGADAIARVFGPKKPKAVRVPVVCMECGRKWSVSPNASPECSRCGSVDIEVR